jgi:hypothetical protein
VQDDRKTFNFDIADLNWGEFMDDWTKGTRQFVFKEPLSSLPEARRRHHRLYWMEAGITVGAGVGHSCLELFFSGCFLPHFSAATSYCVVLICVLVI